MSNARRQAVIFAVSTALAVALILIFGVGGGGARTKTDHPAAPPSPTAQQISDAYVACDHELGEVLNDPATAGSITSDYDYIESCVTARVGPSR